MAELVITSCTVPLPLRAEFGTAGEAIDDGEVVYLKSDGNLWLAKSGGTLAEAAAIGFAVGSAVAGQALFYNETQVMTINAVAAVSVLYFLASTPGKIELESDLAAGGLEYKTLLATGSSTTTLIPKIWPTGVLKP